jgi:hypothetical protein
MPRGRPKKEESQAKKLKDALSENQTESIKELNKAVQSVLGSYRSLVHPDYNDIVNLDDSFISFHYNFKEIIHDD